MDNYQVCVISGGTFAQFQKQLVSHLSLDETELKRLHLMPTCGTRYYRYSSELHDWEEVYAEDIPEVDRERIIKVLNEGIDALGMREAEPFGELIEDRGSQITFSAIGQEAPVDAKKAWDPTGEKKAKLRDYCTPLLPDYEVRTGGLTSIDITIQGIDKAYGMRKLMEQLNLQKSDILYLGDALEPGGNDYSVKEMGIDCIEVRDWEDTAIAIQAIEATAE